MHAAQQPREPSWERPAAAEVAEVEVPAAEAVPGLGPCETHVSPAAMPVVSPLSFLSTQLRSGSCALKSGRMHVPDGEATLSSIDPAAQAWVCTALVGEVQVESGKWCLFACSAREHSPASTGCCAGLAAGKEPGASGLKMSPVAQHIVYAQASIWTHVHQPK